MKDVIIHRTQIKLVNSKKGFIDYNHNPDFFKEVRVGDTFSFKETNSDKETYFSGEVINIIHEYNYNKVKENSPFNIEVYEKIIEIKVYEEYTK